jgi:hypothetical protein
MDGRRCVITTAIKQLFHCEVILEEFLYQIHIHVVVAGLAVILADVGNFARDCKSL